MRITKGYLLTVLESVLLDKVKRTLVERSLLLTIIECPSVTLSVIASPGFKIVTKCSVLEEEGEEYERNEPQLAPKNVKSRTCIRVAEVRLFVRNALSRHTGPIEALVGALPIVSKGHEYHRQVGVCVVCRQHMGHYKCQEEYNQQSHSRLRGLPQITCLFSRKTFFKKLRDRALTQDPRGLKHYLWDTLYSKICRFAPAILEDS